MSRSITIRLPDDLYDHLVIESDEEGRSLNNYIVRRLGGTPTTGRLASQDPRTQSVPRSESIRPEKRVQKGVSAVIGSPIPAASSRSLRRRSGTDKKGLRDANSPEARLADGRAIVEKYLKPRDSKTLDEVIRGVIADEGLKTPEEIENMPRAEWEAYIAASVPQPEPKKGAASMGPDGEAWA